MKTRIVDHIKSWNTIGKIKAVFTILYSLVSLLIHFDTSGMDVLSIFASSFFGCIMITLFIKLFYIIQRKEIVKPTWNDNPLAITQPLKLFHFGAYLFITMGFTMLIETGIRFQNLNLMGLSAVLNGLGILAGIELLLKWKKAKLNNTQ